MKSQTFLPRDSVGANIRLQFAFKQGVMFSQKKKSCGPSLLLVSLFLIDIAVTEPRFLSAWHEDVIKRINRSAYGIKTLSFKDYFIN